MTKLPLVAIVGRTNVGKSSLFNRLIGDNKSIIARESGTTRDTVTAVLNLRSDKACLLADTAGLKLRAEDEFEATIQEQIEEAAEAADLILVVADASTSPSNEDHRVIKTALKSKKPVILAINKTDKATKETLADWHTTPIRQFIETSATQSTGISELIEKLDQAFPKGTSQPPSADLTIGLIGRPNVGKSSLFNALGKKQQALVSAKAGTTRDVGSLELKYHGETWQFLDTAGIRRQGRVQVGIEKFSVLRAMHAIQSSDICLLLLDANEPAVHLEQKLAGLIREQGKGLIVVITKWDSKEKDDWTADELSSKIMSQFQHIWWAPLVLTSAVTGQNVTKLLEVIVKVAINQKRQIPTRTLNRLLEEAISTHPPAGLKNRNPKLRYITQSDVKPPSFRIYGAKTSYLHWSYIRRLDKMIRELADFTGTPLKLYFIDKEPRT